jgi:hypothetical protein
VGQTQGIRTLKTLRHTIALDGPFTQEWQLRMIKQVFQDIEIQMRSLYQQDDEIPLSCTTNDKLPPFTWDQTFVILIAVLTLHSGLRVNFLEPIDINPNGVLQQLDPNKFRAAIINLVQQSSSFAANEVGRPFNANEIPLIIEAYLPMITDHPDDDDMSTGSMMLH